MDIVERVVVELFEQPGPGVVDDGKIHDPTGRRIDRTMKSDLHAVAVAVHARALVAGRHARKVVGGLEREDFLEINLQSGRSLARAEAYLPL